ncbi:MAG: ArsR family transcriptional regulator [Nanoarchaeota archaeon]|nr:ArsR family transcriptional regulator [Nanoarchaeota archaeon]MBU1134928.1 ArsR family transcriptional regulator [Nanoarchaeota archaeon]MBU2519927.1 ArsR family transcriptional regulator [Nanoarchaeota archaeon]
MEYKMTDERWENVMAFIKESIRHPEKTPDDILLLSLSNEELTQLFTKRRIELIKTIKEEKPKTMSDLSKSLGRELSAVERDLKILEGLGIVKLDKKGREVTPIIEKEFLVLPLVEPIGLKEMIHA